MATHVHRVIVRGFFAGLTDGQIDRLRAVQSRHDVFRSAFTKDGTLTYGPDVAAFSFRYEVRTTDDDGPDHHAAALRLATERAEATLGSLGAGHKHLRAVGSDMADVWQDT